MQKKSMNPEEHEFPLIDALDCTILMHRDSHFGGQFEVMIQYYNRSGKGVLEEFDINRIRELAEMERQMGQNLAPLVLSGPDAEMVGKAKTAYKDLRDLYENKTPKNRYPTLIADLILSEEEEPTREIEAIIAEREKIVPELLELIRSEDFHSPLFPGFGQGPILAAKCLGIIGDKRAIIALFESIGGDESNFFDEEVALDALKAIGQPAKEFLLHVLQGRPINEDNERAAIALGNFKNDEEVAISCYNMLKSLNHDEAPLLPSYLIYACSGLKNTPYREEFLSLSKDPKWRQDILAITKDWE